MGGEPSITAILKAANAKCKRCDSQENLSVNHILPCSDGGTHDAENLQILCRKCHDNYHGIISKKELR